MHNTEDGTVFSEVANSLGEGLTQRDSPQRLPRQWSEETPVSSSRCGPD